MSGIGTPASDRERLGSERTECLDGATGASVFLVSFDAHGRLVSASDAFAELIDRPLAGLIGRRFLSLGIVAPQARRRAFGILRQLAELGSAPPTELELMRGARRVVVEAESFLVSPGAAGLTVQVKLRDLTDRRSTGEVDDLRNLAHYIDGRGEKQRKMLARSLHDDIAQPLAALGLHLAWLSSTQPPEVSQHVSQFEATLSGVVSRLREIMGRLRPDVLDDFGLTTAIRGEVEAFRKRTGIECHVNLRGGNDLVPDSRAVAIFRTLQEALAHAAARGAAHVTIDVEMKRAFICILIEDDGLTIPDSILEWDLIHIGMRERLQALGGTLSIAAMGTSRVNTCLLLPGPFPMTPA